MTPVKSVRLQVGELLAADATTLAPAVNENQIALIITDFTENEDLVIGDLDLATFNGSAPKDGVAGDQQAGIDPLTGDQVVTILPPVGGYRFECAVAPAAPEVVFGYALTTAAGAALLGVAKLPEPVTIESVGDFVDLGPVTLRIAAQPIS